MKEKLRNNKGSILILVSVLLPILISAVGICIDGALVTYYQSRLMVATKFAAVSATSYYTVENDKAVINASEDKVKEILTKNFSEATLKEFTVDSTDKSKCKVKAQVDVKFVFMKAFGIDSKTISEVYTATRS